MDFDLLRRQPFHAASKPEAAADAGQRREPVAQQRPGAPARGQSVVVMRLAVMDEQPDALALLEAVIEISRDVPARVILEQLGVGPVQTAFGEQGFGGFPGAAEALELENRLGMFLLHARDDILPGGHWHLVASNAEEAVVSAPALGQ